MITIKEPNIILVEGVDEEQFCDALIKKLNFQNIQILPIGGKTKLRKNLKGLIGATGFSNVSSLGIIRDADASSQSAFQSVCDALRYVNLPVPSNPLTSQGQNPKVTVMILPDENNSGMLEDLCLRAVESEPEVKCVKQYFQCLQQYIDLPKNISKAKVQAYLASKPKSGLRLGEAAQAGYWPLEDEIFEPMINFLQLITH